MGISQQKLEELLHEHFANAEVSVQMLSADEDHYAATIRSAEFKGKSRIQQHQMVYEALQGAMDKDLHALAIKTEVLEA